MAFLLPVTLNVRSPWHSLHSLIPGWVAIAEGIGGLNRQSDVIVINQDLDKDTHIWSAVFGKRDPNHLGRFAELLPLIGDRVTRMSRRAAGRLTRSTLLTRRPHRRGHWPGKKLNNVEEDLEKTSYL